MDLRNNLNLEALLLNIELDRYFERYEAKKAQDFALAQALIDAGDISEGISNIALGQVAQYRKPISPPNEREEGNIFYQKAYELIPEEFSQAVKKSLEKTLEKTSTFIGKAVDAVAETSKKAYKALPEGFSQAIEKRAEKTVKFADEAITTISETSHRAYHALPENVTQKIESTIEKTAEIGGELIHDIAEAPARRDSEYRQTLRDMGVPAETAAKIVRYKNDALEVASDAFDVVTSVVPIVGGLKGIKLAKKLSTATNASRTVEALDLQSTAKAVKSKSKKRPHTWEAREGQEWKQKIFGKGQNTGTPGHALQGYRDAIPMAKSDEYEAVYLNLGIKGILKRHGLENVYKGRNRIPDVTGVRKDKKIGEH